MENDALAWTRSKARIFRGGVRSLQGSCARAEQQCHPSQNPYPILVWAVCEVHRHHDDLAALSSHSATAREALHGIP
eukprot:1341644-Rhodomonas_salina.2